MSYDDNNTPVQAMSPEFQVESLRVQLAELRKEHEAWRPIVETAKILINAWKGTAGDFTQPVSDAVDMLFRMVEAADAVRQREND
jgi:hypothetical protein